MTKHVLRAALIAVVLAAGMTFAAQVEPQLATTLNSASPDAKFPVEFFMKAQANAAQLDASLEQLPRPQRRARVREVLEQYCAGTQRDLLNYLNGLDAARVDDVRSLWLVNLISCWATKEVIYAVAARPDVELVLYGKVPVKLDAVKLENVVAAIDQVEPNLITTNARGAWNQGYHGEDVVIGVVDTGVRYTHLDLRDHLWTSTEYPNCGFNFASSQYSSGHPGPSTYDTLTPMDYYGHGTHCAGITSADGAYGNGTRDTMGVAPAAKLMSCPIDVYLHSPYPDTSMENNTLAGMQFCVSPTRDPTNGADVITMSLGLISSWLPRRAVWRAAEENVMTAGLVHCVAAGNEGSGARTIRTSGDCPPPWPNPVNHPSDRWMSAVITIGATDNSDNIASFSSRGPSDWGSVAPYNDYAYPPGLMDPDVCMPGVNILSTYNSGDQAYTTMSGTSMATPGAAGVVALMFSKNPNLTPRMVDSILECHAVTDLGPSGKENTFGAGRLNCSLAVAFTPLPGPSHNLGVGPFLSPAPRVDPNVALTPMVLVANNGTYEELSVPVYLTIDSAGTEIYSQALTIPDIDSAATDTAVFPNWTPAGGGNSYNLTAWHGYSPDTNRANDTFRLTVYTKSHDVAATATNFSGRVRSGQPITPKLTLTATGDYTESNFQAHCWIDSAGTRLYDEFLTVDSVVPGTPVLVSFPDWTPGPDSATYDVTLFHSLAGDQIRGNDTLHRVVMASDFVMRVAIELSSSSPGRTPPNAIYRIDSLCDALGWEDSIVIGTDINTVDKLSNFSVVVTGSDGHYQATDMAAYQDALLEWVRGGGGFVGCGWIIYGVCGEISPSCRMDTVLPARTTGNYNFVQAGGTVDIENTTHPVTTGVNSFPIQNYGEYASAGIWPDAEQLATYSAAPGQASVAVRELGSGRTVYLGPIYYGDFATYSNAPYYDDLDAMLLMKQAIEWASGGGVSAVKEGEAGAPIRLRFGLKGAVPNPMSRTTAIRYTLPSATPVSLTVYDLTGRQVTQLVRGSQLAGNYSAAWNRKDRQGQTVPAGVYLVRLTAGSDQATGKLIVE